MQKQIPFKGKSNPNRRAKITAQTHRFGDLVCVYIGTGESVYLEPRQARALATALHRVARSCETEKFADSTGLTTEFEFSPVGDQ